MEQDYTFGGAGIKPGGRFVGCRQHHIALVRGAAGTGKIFCSVTAPHINLSWIRRYRMRSSGLFDDLVHHLHVAGGESSVDREYGTRDPSGLVRCEEEGGSGHILRLADAA
jgi:hypothetical protein